MGGEHSDVAAVLQPMPSVPGTPTADPRDDLIADQQEEIAALRAALEASGIPMPSAAARTPVRRGASNTPQKKTPKFADHDGADDEYAFYDMDTSTLVRPSELLIGSNVGHNFKHIMSDFSEMQRRILKRVLAATEKRERVNKYMDRLQKMKDKVCNEADESHKMARSTIRQLQTELNKVEEALLAHLKRVERANHDTIDEQVQFCDSLIADIDEGLALAKDFLAENKDESEAKPPQVIQSVEVGLDELQEATIKKKPNLTPFGVLDATAAFSAFQNMSFRPRDIDDATDPIMNASRAVSPPAYERLHRIAVRKRLENMQSPQPGSTEPFSSFPASPPHSTGVGISSK